MSTEKKTKKSGFMLKAMSVLLGLTLISTYFCSSLYAKFAMQAPGSALASAADFRVMAEGDVSKNPAEMEIVAYENDGRTVYSVVLHNKSDVAVEYNAQIEVDGEKLLDEQGEAVVLRGTLEAGADKSIDLPLYVQNEDVLDYDAGTGVAEVPFTALVTFSQID